MGTNQLKRRGIGLVTKTCFWMFSLCLLQNVAAQEGILPQATSYVTDYARVIDPAAKEQIERLCRELETKTGTQLAVVTLGSLGGDPIEDFAVKLFEQWGIGKKDKSNGLLLLIAVQDRKSRIEVGYGLEPVITDGISGEILRSLRPYFRANQYGEGLHAGTSALASIIAEHFGVQLSSEPYAGRYRSSKRNEPQPAFGPLGALIILGLFFLLPLLLSAKRRPIYRSIPGRFYRGGGFPGDLSGLGGMGGRDSGSRDEGGFGGFGGGLSGGGGSSGDW
jgi:uncharacterized protein